MLVATENGFGKRTEFSEYRLCHRGGHGVIAIEGADRNGKVVSAHAVSDDESIISITSDAQMVRSPVSQITVVGRAARGVRLVRLSEGASLVSVSVCEGASEESPAAEQEGSAAEQIENSNESSNEGE